MFFPSRSGTVGAPSLRSLQGRVRCCLYHGVCHAQRPASHLRRSSPALHHLRANGGTRVNPICLETSRSPERSGRRAPTILRPRSGFRQRARTPANRLNFNVWTTKKRVEKLRYMHRNPVKRGLVSAPEQWRWSSYRFYLLEEAGPVRVNEGWAKISLRNRAA